MRFLFFIFFLSSCESLFFQEFKIKHFPKSSKNEQLYYKVEKGDNLYFISKKFNVTIPKLINYNNINAPYKIYPNQRIFIPKKRIHIVKKGDTLYSISRKYKTDLFIVAKFNNLKNVNQINVKQKLVIPDYFFERKNIKKKVVKKSDKLLKRKKKKQRIISRKDEVFVEKFIWPIDGKVISKYGSDTPGFFNDGINIKSSTGKDIKASHAGEVVYSGNEIPGYGNLILIKHPKNWITAYAHLQKIYKKKGAKVKQGEFIGSVGKSGNVQEPQLHFEIRKGKEAVNPLKYLS